jgi:hypothetical protein
MKQIILVFIILISNWTFSQNDSISLALEVYNRRFELSEPVLPDYPMFKGLELNAIWECLVTLEIMYHVKEDIDFTAVRTQIFDRLKQMATILANEGTFFYLSSGYDCYNSSTEKNKNYLITKELYQCVGDCRTSLGYSEGKDIVNKTTREIQNNIEIKKKIK